MTKSEDGIERMAEAVRQAALLATRHLLNRDELSVSAMEVLHTLSVEGPTRLTALSEAIHLSQPAMTQLIQRLDRRNLVIRVADPEDGRATIVDITATARHLLQRLRNDDNGKLAALLATLSGSDQEALRLAMHVAGPILQRLNDNASLLARTTTGSRDEQTIRNGSPQRSIGSFAK
ncbi:MarR family winged helix-turn-helix transcriptional regulator [Mycolicibacterium sp. CBMA 226]|uniref:MarR family winged helix-turn-helix transcriptional regulator n=1 Tax=Mycolicibacterium sp. CBMA 226 TaxID=2606611 RepID=UPI0012DC079B|nr:MarR family transcriptional regulator [Mycolicibacterium sp. CBMA 226]MUL75140.1 MarR family transcriptional regulator [Mycolicibacterium sp. CBMA 226]